VIDIIHQTLVAGWKAQGHGQKKIDALWNAYVPKHLLTRLHGYELLMAPYAIAHLKIGLKLYETGYRFGSDERARVYLTNALEPAGDFSGRFEFAIPALAREAEAVNEIKRRGRFTVVVGNPPYAGHSLNNQVTWIVDKVYDYKRGYADLQKPGQAKWLQDDYVKFLRFAEWQVERSTSGILGFITNHAWLDNPTFKGMRQHFLGSFDQLSVLDLHGNANKKERTAEGTPDKNVFDIMQGVAVSLLRLSPGSLEGAERLVHRSDLFGSEAFKYETLTTRTVISITATQFRPLPPELIFASLDDDRKREYDTYLSIPQIMNGNGDPAPGIVTTHDEFAISFSKKEQIEKVEALLATRTETEARKLFRLCSQNQWIYTEAKRGLWSKDWRKNLMPILYRPFDERWTVYNRYVAVHRRERVSKHLRGGENRGLISVRQVAEGVFSHALVCKGLVESRITISNKGIGFVLPLWLEPEWPDTKYRPNLSATAIRQLAESIELLFVQPQESGIGDGRGDMRVTFGPRDVFDFTYAILHSIEYRRRYADFLKSDFARIPFGPEKTLFRALSRLGGELVSLHLLESPKLDRPITEFTGSRAPVVEKVSYSGNTVWIDKAQTTGFAGVPEDVWIFHICGYQVCQKWLKDRGPKKGQPGRTLSAEDIAHYQKIVVALSETIRLMKEIDEVIEKHGGWPGAFQTGGQAEAGEERIGKAAERRPPYGPSRKGKG